MATLVLGPTPPELTGFLERRRSMGQDRFDEVWEGVYHVAPAPNAWHGYAALRVGNSVNPRWCVAQAMAKRCRDLAPLERLTASRFEALTARGAPAVGLGDSNDGACAGGACPIR